MNRWSKICIRQKNCGYHLERLRCKGIIAVNIIPKGEQVIFCVKSKQLKQTIEYLKSVSIEYAIVGDNTAKAFFKRQLNHITLYIGAIIIVGLIFLLSNLCFDIKVDCENQQLANQVEYLIKQQKVVGKVKNSIDKKLLEDIIVQNLPQVAFAQVYFEGSVVKVDVVCQQVSPPEVKYTRIVASQDAVISRILCFSGTPLVSVGQSVKKGQILIDGFIEVGKPEDENYQKIAVEAKGEIFARTWESQSLALEPLSIVFERSGKKQTFYEYIVFGKVITNKKACQFEYFEKQTSQQYLGNVLPLKANVYTYYELCQKEVELTQADIESKIFEAKSNILARLTHQEKVCLDWKIEKKLDNLLKIDIYYEIEKLIAVGES